MRVCIIEIVFCYFFMSFYFFFQAEDGIRDWSVTGVQTCALPICAWLLPAANCARRRLRLPRLRRQRAFTIKDRSEERRVGKECRSRWWPYQEKNKTEKKLLKGKPHK